MIHQQPNYWQIPQGKPSQSPDSFYDTSSQTGYNIEEGEKRLSRLSETILLKKVNQALMLGHLASTI